MRPKEANATTNSVEPDQTVSQKQSDLALHSLSKRLEFLYNGS